MTPFLDPVALVEWPRAAGPATLRPLSLDDVDAIHDYRSRVDVCTYLSHEPMTRDEVVARTASRLPGSPASAARLVRGLAVVLDGEVVGDAMLRVSDEGLRIGYALHPQVWGRGLATHVARELTAIGHGLGLDVWADVRPGNTASVRVLLKNGFVEVAPGEFRAVRPRQDQRVRATRRSSRPSMPTAIQHRATTTPPTGAYQLYFSSTDVVKRTP